MAITKTSIANKSMVDLGEELFTDVDTDGTTPADIFNASWETVLGEALNTGPENGWKFSRRTYNLIQRQSSSITAFSDYTGTVAGTVLATDTGHPYITGDLVEISGGSTGSYDGNEVVTRVDANSYYFTATFVATETATAKWTSERFLYRYARPTCTRITTVSSGGIELTDWIREGAYILTNQEATEVDMAYILDVSDVTIANFPWHFVDVLWRRMAACLAYHLQQNRALSNDKLNTLEQIYIPRAIGMDNRERYAKEFSHSWADIGRKTSTIEGDYTISPNTFRPYR